ncbi:MAG: hypothetical protein Q4F83_06080 [Eubacteriales bacterium]|nr:hypothetical protein [Eubacteriales bacterium]
MKITEQNFIFQMRQGNEKALEYVMVHYGGLTRPVIYNRVSRAKKKIRRLFPR